MVMLTPNFSMFEFGLLSESKPELISNAIRICTDLEVIRVWAQSPIRITSGYRSPEHNARVGGSPRSKHLAAKAVDFQVMRGRYKDAALLADLVEQLIEAREIPDGGLGRYSTWVHYDHGREGRRWNLS